MSADEKQVEEAALTMDVLARGRLISKLIRSIEHVGEEENLRLWGQEAARRDAELDAGEEREIPIEEVMREVDETVR